MKVRIVAKACGPFVVEGDVDLVDADGRPVDLDGRRKVALCRCGASKTKPMCDGAHYRVPRTETEG